MILYLGDFAVGSTIYIPFQTFDKDDGSAITMTGLAVTGIEIYKNGSTTQRASDNGVSLVDTDGIDFDGITGKHGFSINTADNSDAGFFVAGADYWVMVTGLTVDSVSVSFWAAIFSIENRRTAGELIRTTIATLASQTSFTLTAGSADDDAYNNCVAIISDIASATQKAIARISDYTGSTKTITLAAAPCFSIAAGDNITIVATSALAHVASMAADSITSSAIADDAEYTLDEIAAAMWSALVSGIATENSIGKRIIDYLTGDIYARIGAAGAGLTALGDTRLANLDATISSRLATSGYTAPDNATITAIAGYLDTEIAAIITHLTDIKGAGWATESLKNIRDAITALRGADDDTLKTLSDQIDGVGGGGGGDATAANQTTIINHLTDIKGPTWAIATDSLKAIRDRGDVAWITGSGLAGANTVMLTIQDDSGNNIPEAAVEVYDSAGTTFYERKQSNSSGQTIFKMDDGTYTIVVHKAGYSWSNTALVVAGDMSQTITGTANVLPAPVTPDMCRISMYVKYLDGTIPTSLTTALSIIELPHIGSNTAYSGVAFEGIYNSSTGLLYWDILQGAMAVITVEELGIDRVKITIPSTATAEIEDLL